jgi:hypothetical protein
MRIAQGLTHAKRGRKNIGKGGRFDVRTAANQAAAVGNT